MPGYRQPGTTGRMVGGYAGFARPLGLYPHSGNDIPKIDCILFKTLKSDVLFSPDHPLADPLLQRKFRTRQAKLATEYGKT